MRITQVEDEKRCCDQPIKIANVKELSAAGNGSPTLARKHGKVRKGCNSTNKGVGEVVFPSLSVGIRCLCNHNDGGHRKSKEAKSQGAHAS